MRRVVSALIALAAVAGAAASQPSVEQRRSAEARGAAEKAAAPARQHAKDALETYLDRLKSSALAAASLPPLRAQIALLRTERFDGQLGKTLEDWLAAEKDWEPFRREFSLYGLGGEGDKLGLLHGMAVADLASDLLVHDARENGSAARIIVGRGEPFAAAAARVTVPGLAAPIVVVLAKPFAAAALKDVAERSMTAVLLSNGRTALAQQGRQVELDRLREAVGHEAPGLAYVAADGGWSAGLAPVVPGFWLWAYAASDAEAATAVQTAKTTKVVVWSVSALIAGLALFFGFRQRSLPIALSGGEPLAGGSVSNPGYNTRMLGDAPRASASVPAPAAARTEVYTGAPPAARNTPSSRTFGRYTLLDRLGEGGMAQVFTAVSFGAEGFRRKFVVKRLRPELVGDTSVVDQFKDEANMASSLVHSNIIPVLDFGKVDDEYFMATEYILGRDLGRVTRECQDKDHTSMPLAAVLYAAHETLKALEYAHTRTGENGRWLSIVHRDVSPNNVLVSARGEVKLFDFGIVKAEGRVTRTQHGVVKGNVSYMSPEQARGIDIDARADLFSLGLVIYYCLAGDVLYQGTTTYELLVKAATGPGPEDLARINALPAPAAALLTRALAIDPAARFQSASEFAAAVVPHMAGGAAELATLMTHLFADDFRKEEERFATAVPIAAAESAAAPGAVSSTLPRT
jgi:hypothetical protein